MQEDRSSLSKRPLLNHPLVIVIIGGLVVSLILNVVTLSKGQLTRVELQEVADKIVNRDAFRKVLLDEFSMDERFKGIDGSNGTDGIDGTPGLCNVIKVGNNNCATLGDNKQICWGYQDLSTQLDHTRSFSFDFASSFTSPPIVTNGINADGKGWNFSVYQNILSASLYSGRLVSDGSLKNSARVRMNYIAIGDK